MSNRRTLTTSIEVFASPWVGQRGMGPVLLRRPPAQVTKDVERSAPRKTSLTSSRPLNAAVSDGARRSQTLSLRST
jgi:hypothetical protein